MRYGQWMLAGAMASVAALNVSPATAQKAQDTLRIAVTETFKGLSPYYYPATEASNFYSRVYDTLIAYNEHQSKFVPSVAKNWQRVGDTVLEFELRDDLVFHNGDKLTADDVVSTLRMGADGKYNFQFKSRYTWVKNVEKLGPYKVRVTATALNAGDLMHMAYRAYVENARVFHSHEEPSEYGLKTPIGTGPYKVVDFDRNRGLTVERFGGAKTGRAPINRVRAAFIPDQQTQIAELLVGNIDVMVNISTDNAKMVATNLRLATTAVDSMTVAYLLLDAAGRSGRKELTDPRVRRAIAMAINRKAIKDLIVPGGAKATLAGAMCFKGMLGCAWSQGPAPYDPEGARKLLAEAGYPSGFDISFTVQQVVRDAATAVAGDLRRIGIRATIDVATLVIFRKKRSEGSLQLFAGYYPNGSFPYADNALDVFFGDESRDYTRDPYISERFEAARRVHDLQKQTALYRELFDRINEQAYYVPISSLPVMWAHSRDVRLEPNPTSANNSDIGDFFWN